MPGEKTEKATPKRKQDERKKGNIFLSQEVVTVFTLIATFYVIKMMMPYALKTLEEAIQHYTRIASTEDTLTYNKIRSYYFDSLIVFAKTALIPLFACGLVAILSTMMQTKMLFSPKAFAFKGERINPLQGFKKMFSMRALVELAKSVLKITILLYVIYTILKDEIYLLPRMMDMSFNSALSKTGAVIMEIVVKAGMIFVFLAAADYLYQWWQYEKNLRMTKQEIKDEYKQIEGDPQIKSRIRSIQQQRAKQRMMQNVPNADVVIRNPTHYAVAIKYDQNANRAPVVVAKGADSIALRIVKVAEENGVYVTENKPLARALYESVDLDKEVPERFYRALAEVLAFVYSLKKKELK
ncbi:MAG: flagellar biosynthesis protein FlhB [Clostridiales bacterium]|nr:flagellar biosynthesis protein FlhB [Clostridiales bacterium]